MIQCYIEPEGKGLVDQLNITSKRKLGCGERSAMSGCICRGADLTSPNISLWMNCGTDWMC